jgi:hypothetical protein
MMIERPTLSGAKLRFCLVVVTVSAVAAETRLNADESHPLSPAAQVLDPDIIFYSWPYPVVSPDGKQVAYVSRGFICVADVAKGETRRIAEVPGT